MEQFQSKPYNQKASNRYNLRIHLRCELLLIQDLKLNAIDLKVNDFILDLRHERSRCRTVRYKTHRTNRTQ